MAKNTVKMKSHGGAKKRFKITKNGKIKYQKTNRRHRLTQKATKRKRIIRSGGYCGSETAKAIKKLLPYA